MILRSLKLYYVVEGRDCTLKDMMKNTKTVDSMYTKFLKFDVPGLVILSNKVNVVLSNIVSLLLLNPYSNVISTIHD